MILIFKETRTMKKHNRDSVIRALGKVAQDGDICNFDEGEAKVLLKDFPNNWFDYNSELEKQKAESEKKQKELVEQFKKKQSTEQPKPGQPKRGRRSTTAKEDK